MYSFTVVNDTMEFETNMNDFVVNHHALGYNSTVSRSRSWL